MIIKLLTFISVKTATTIISHLENLKSWVMKQHSRSTCGLVTLPMTPFDTKEVQLVVNMIKQTHELNTYIKRELNGDLMPPESHTSVRNTGFEEGSRVVTKHNDWTGENVVKSDAAKCFTKSRQLALGNACVKYFKIKYKLTKKVPRPVHEEQPFSETRRIRNRMRTERRRKKKEEEGA